jgi:hypothetical protein
VQPDLPETGVCNSNPVLDDDTIAAGASCCGPTAPAAPATLQPITIGAKPIDEQAGSCC